MKIFGMESGKLSKWLAIVLAVSLALTLSSLWASGLPRAIREGRNWPLESTVGRSRVNVDESEIFPAEEVESMEIQLGFEQTFIRGTTGNNITVRYYGDAAVRKRVAKNFSIDEVLTIKTVGGRLVVKSDWNKLAVIRRANLRLEVGLPSGAVDELKFHASSGTLSLDGVDLGSLDAQASSGEMDVRNLEADGTLSMGTSSGAVRAQNITMAGGSIGTSSGAIRIVNISSSAPLSLRTSSGRIRTAGIRAPAVNGRASSGKAEFKELSGDLIFRSSSGTVEAAFEAPGELIDISATSGGIRLALPPETDFHLDAQVSSGSINSDFPLTVTGSLNKKKLEGRSGGETERRIVLKTSSGSINIDELNK